VQPNKQEESKAMTMKSRVESMLDKTRDAYSFSYYGENGWRECIEMLFGEGWQESHVEAILRSKHMRWADDNTPTTEHSNAATLANYINQSYIDRSGRGRIAWNKEVESLVAQTFPTQQAASDDVSALKQRVQKLESALQAARDQLADTLLLIHEALKAT
jgi:hypothetical protein